MQQIYELNEQIFNLENFNFEKINKKQKNWQNKL